jgi:predicted phosphodiesterase
MRYVKLGWTLPEIEIVRNGIRQNLTWKTISQVLREAGFDRTPEATRKYYERNIGLARPQRPPRPIVTQKSEDEALRAMVRMREQARFDFSAGRFAKIGKPVTADFKVLTISDSHIQAFNADVLQTAIGDNKDANMLVINGDLLDTYMIGRWPKNKTNLLIDEYKQALEFIKMCSDIFPKVVLVMGNHEFRFSRYFAKQVSESVAFMFNPHILHYLSRGLDIGPSGYLDFPRYDFSNVYYDQGPISWYTIVGKTIFVHPCKSYSGVRIRTAMDAYDYFKPREDFECIVLAHTHQHSKVTHEGKLLIEQGCTCIPLPYESEGNLKMKIQSFGYATVYMDAHGHVDFHNSNFTYLGTGTPVKDHIFETSAA